MGIRRKRNTMFSNFALLEVNKLIIENLKKGNKNIIFNGYLNGFAVLNDKDKDLLCRLNEKYNYDLSSHNEKISKLNKILLKLYEKSLNNIIGKSYEDDILYKIYNNIIDVYHITNEYAKQIFKACLVLRYIADSDFAEYMLRSCASNIDVDGKTLNMRMENFEAGIQELDTLKIFVKKYSDNNYTVYPYDFNYKIYDIIKKKIVDKDKILEILLGKKIESKDFAWNDFNFVDDKDLIYQLLKKKDSFNILLYGAPGTGKTEFAKLLCKKLNLQLFSLNNKHADNKDENRITDINVSDALLNEKSCLLVDEADDIFTMCNKKDLINSLLDNCDKKHIYIMNSTYFVDTAYLRRFDYSIYFKKPDKNILKQMWRKQLKTLDIKLSPKYVNNLTEKYDITPSFLTNSLENAKLLINDKNSYSDKFEIICKMVDNKIQLQNNGIKIKEEVPNIMKEDKNFNINLLNTDIDLEKLAERIVSLNKMNFSLCLNGVSGTGKSAYAEYLAERMGIPVIKKKCSDLLDMYVGGSEKNIADAFREASEKHAMLIFDEADSFLNNRNNAQRQWEVTQVNEMLTQMESHQFPFVCTTNLMDSLDKASLRRFTFKVKYDYMTSEQNTLAFKHFFGFDGVKLNINTLTPGDFVVVKNKAEIMDYLDNKDELIKMLEQEQINKPKLINKIGF